MDRIIESLLRAFAEENDLQEVAESVLFEYFCAHVIASNHFLNDSLNISDIVVGGGE